MKCAPDSTILKDTLSAPDHKYDPFLTGSKSPTGFYSTKIERGFLHLFILNNIKRHNRPKNCDVSDSPHFSTLHNHSYQ